MASNTVPPLTGGCHCKANRFTISTSDPTAFASMPRFRQMIEETGKKIPIAAEVNSDVEGALPFEATVSHSRTEYASSANTFRTFCPTCGTRLTNHMGGTGRVAVYVGALDHPDRVVPSMAVHGQDAVKGFTRPDLHVPMLVKGKDGMELAKE
ncbi:hypothetical protein HK097_004624 [Rhizophlyctis rosea]|uniref:CENP-V/GFA domain-containing protein n=1 Tax=Rhizophlyctis rosea TaxID=64517 RepID=A0AAD5SHB5_9FUNG|nr:hypothetical protein HK097_004624 [Rhizophlyctis rosea]